MKLLILKPNVKTIAYSYKEKGSGQPFWSGSINFFQQKPSELIERISEDLKKDEIVFAPDAIAVLVRYGGEDFHGPVVADEEVIEKLETMIPQASLHLPLTISLIKSFIESVSQIPIILVFETAFFADLPQREQLYGLDPELSKSLGFRRFGFNGLYHEAASKYVQKTWEASINNQNLKILSICMEPQPEVSSVLGGVPQSVTSGISPLEGIPGQTTCGELDPSVILNLVQTVGWGPEQINWILTQKSGLLGLVGHPMTLETLFASNDEDSDFCRKIIQYRILQACGAGIAAMGGLDCIVFSGRYASVGESFGPWLTEKLAALPGNKDFKNWKCFYSTLDKIIFDVVDKKIATCFEEEKWKLLYQI